MNLRFRIQCAKSRLAGQIAAGLREAAYETRWEGDRLALNHRMGFGYFQNGVGIFMVKEVTLHSEEGHLELRMILNKEMIVGLIICYGILILSQFVITPNFIQAKELLIAIPFLITLALLTLLATQVSTIRRDVKRVVRTNQA